MFSLKKSLRKLFFIETSIKQNQRSIIYLLLFISILFQLLLLFLELYKLFFFPIGFIISIFFALKFQQKNSSYAIIFYSSLILTTISSILFEKEFGFYISFFAVCILNVLLFPISKIKLIHFNFVFIFISILLFLVYENLGLYKLSLNEKYKIFIFKFIFYSTFFFICYSIVVLTISFQNLESEILVYNHLHIEIFENQIYSFFQLDKNFIIEKFNKKASELFFILFQKEILVGNNFLDYFLNIEEKLSLKKNIEFVLNSDSKIQIEREFVFEKLSIWFALSINKIEFDTKESKLILCFRNITNLKETEFREHELKNLAELVHIKKTNFVKTVTNEMLNPLNRILEINESIDKKKLNNKELEYFQLIEFSTNHLISFMQDLKTNSEFISEKILNKTSKDNLKLRTRLLFESFKLTNTSKKIEFKFEEDEKIPNELQFDHNLISQLLSNLLSNAFKFTQEGEIVLRLKLLEISDKVKIYFEVSDTGIGIKKENSDIIFRNFSQADNEIYSKFGGTGLGLGIVKKILDELNSKIKLESELGVGSKFSFILEMEN